MRAIQKGATDRSVIIRIIDSTDGTPETGVVYNTSGIDLWYRREGATVTSITEATLAAVDSAHSDGGIIHLGNGYYRLDLPDAAFATGANHVMIGGTVTGMIVIGQEIQLVNYNPEDAVRLGLTALPNAAADAAGGLPISDAGGLDLDAKLANTNEVTAARMGALTDWINGGRLDLILDATATAAELAKVPKSDSNVTWNATALASINAEVDTALNTAIPETPTSGSVNDKLANLASEAEIADAVLDEAMSGHTTAGTLGAAVADILVDTNELQTDWHDGGRLDLILDAASAPSAAAVADAVWDEAISGHLTSGTTGAALNAAGGSGDPWETSLPGSYGAGTAGKIIGDNINATISSRSTLTAQQVWEYATRTLSSFGSLVADTATAVWGAATRTLSAFGFNVTVGTNSDKTGYSLASPQTFNLTGDITGSLSGSVGSVTGAVGSVTGNVGGSVASVTAGVTVTTNNDKTGYTASTVSDKTGYSLATTPPTAAQVRAEIDSNSTQLAAIKAKTDALPGGVAKNAALPNFYFFMVISSDHYTGATGKTVTAEISKDGGAFAACTNSPTELSGGVYVIDLTQAEMNADIITLKFTETDCDARIITIKTDA